MTVVCGDSHTSTHGAFGSLAMGIGTSEVEHVLATQTLPLRPFKTMAVNVDGQLPAVSAKDIILAVIAKIGTGGGQGHVIEYRGSAIEALSMEGRMTICNMSIEAGARAGMVAPDETTYEFLRGRPHAPGADWDAAVAAWDRLRTDEGAEFDTEVYIDAATLSPFVTWGTNPGQGVPLSESVPDPELMLDDAERQSAEKALAYMIFNPARPCATSRWTRCSWARAPTAASKICAWWPTYCVAERSPTAWKCWLCPVQCGCARRPNPKGSVRSSPPERSGDKRALHVSRHEPRSVVARTAVRIDVEPKFRGQAGQGRPDTSGVARGRRRDTVRGTLSSPADLSS